MQDRVSTYPNRWKLTPVAGQTNVYDFERADEPVVAGTPINKATFLTNETAAAIAALSGATPTLPTEALSAIAAILSDIGSASSITRFAVGTYTGTGSSGASNPTSLTFPFEPKFLLVYQNNEIFSLSATNGFIWVYNNSAFTNGSITVNDDTVSWYSTTNAGYQRNASGQVYVYFALGVES